MILVIPLSACFCLGRCEFGRLGWSTGQGGGTLKIRVNPTKTRYATTRVTLYMSKNSTPVFTMKVKLARNSNLMYLITFQEEEAEEEEEVDIDKEVERITRLQKEEKEKKGREGK